MERHYNQISNDSVAEARIQSYESENIDVDRVEASIESSKQDEPEQEEEEYNELDRFVPFRVELDDDMEEEYKRLVTDDLDRTQAPLDEFKLNIQELEPHLLKMGEIDESVLKEGRKKYDG